MDCMGRERKPVEKRKSYAEKKLLSASIPGNLLKTLMKQKYCIVGSHSAAKLCHWAGKSLCGQGECYKSRFYGISSHRCLQCTPVLLSCNHACVFCWRAMPERGNFLGNTPVLEPQPQSEDRYGKAGGFEWDEPEKIVDGLISAQRKLVSGYGGNPKTNRKGFAEALEPKHAAISLTGEPCMYPKLGELIAEFHERGMTTFLVTNGTFPEVLGKLAPLPTQLYISMVAPNEEVYRAAIRPSAAGLWKKYWKCLGLLPKLGEMTRTVLRMTLCRGVNDADLDGYATQILLAKPHYVEVKSMVFVGGARNPGRGLSLGSMLSMEEARGIANELSRKTGYGFVDEHPPSRVALLCRDRRTENERKILWH